MFRTIDPASADRLIFVGLMDTYGRVYVADTGNVDVDDYVVHETLAENICNDRGWTMGPHGYKETLYMRGWALLAVDNHDNYVESIRINNDQSFALFDLFNSYKSLAGDHPTRHITFALDGLRRALGINKAA